MLIGIQSTKFDCKKPLLAESEIVDSLSSG